MTSTPQATVPWWQTVTAYQIYPRSFCNSNGDGIGDIPGIISKLDYLADLGVGVVWLSPINTSPMVDMGYDISDYRDIAPEFGTLADFDQMIAEGRRRGIRFIMDLVVNHSSDQHPWFQDAISGRDAAFRDYYIWRDPAPDGGPPNDMMGFFGRPAWTLDPRSGQYYFHLFDPAQPDLNWQNPKVRAEVHDIMRFWLDRGVAGFRMDAIDLIGKDVDAGIALDGPDLHPYLREIHDVALAGRDTLTVGETSSARVSNALQYTAAASRELSMVHQFEHIQLTWDKQLGKWASRDFALTELKAVFDRWQNVLADDGWNALFWSNHDLPRAVSKYGDDRAHRIASAKMLATALHLMKGTPFIYQGEELGMTNAIFIDPGQFRDVEALNNYQIQIAAGMSREEFFRAASENCRDNARTPMQWTSGHNAGFSSATPWIALNPNYDHINAEAQINDENSVFAHYRHLIRLRRDLPIVSHGSYTPLAPDHPAILAYSRALDGEILTVLCNFKPFPVTLELRAEGRVKGRCLTTNAIPRDTLGDSVALKPFEAVAVLGRNTENC